jgi:hypothetical protein
MKEFGKPSKLDCHERATFPHETTALTSHESFVAAFFAKVMASTESTRDAAREASEESNMKM